MRWPRFAPWLIAGLLAVFALVIVRTAWLSEDAYFTFRSVENWVHGYGARWNVLERVQVYTHPLWFGLASVVYFVTRNMAVTGFALGMLSTAGALAILIRWIGASWEGTSLALIVLIGSKAFADYSTSGLENPLSHLLLLGFFASFWADPSASPSSEPPSDSKAAERKLATTCLFGGLLVCNRMDLGLILAPALVYALWPPRLTLRRVLAIGLGFSPLIVWELISLVYYGFLVPNTAYAKLGAQLPRELVLENGVHYFKNSLQWDPLTLFVIGAAIVVSAVQLRSRPRQACAALGALLYLGYILNIGGDYMTGRFFTAPLVVAVALIANLPPMRRWQFFTGLALVLALAAWAPVPTLLAGRSYDAKVLGSDGKIDDERGYRHIFTGLISERETEFLVNSGWYKRGVRDRERAEARGELRVRVNRNGGYMGFAAGPIIHYINPYAITDPLLARLPGQFHGPGHIRRTIPAGYREAAVGRGELHDPNLAEYWRQLSLIVSGPIWSRERWVAIWRMHVGANQPLLDAYLAAVPPPKPHKQMKLGRPKAKKKSSNKPTSTRRVKRETP